MIAPVVLFRDAGAWTMPLLGCMALTAAAWLMWLVAGRRWSIPWSAPWVPVTLVLMAISWSSVNQLNLAIAGDAANMASLGASSLYITSVWGLLVGCMATVGMATASIQCLLRASSTFDSSGYVGGVVGGGIGLLIGGTYIHQWVGLTGWMLGGPGPYLLVLIVLMALGCVTLAGLRLESEEPALTIGPRMDVAMSGAGALLGWAWFFRVQGWILGLEMMEAVPPGPKIPIVVANIAEVANFVWDLGVGFAVVVLAFGLGTVLAHQQRPLEGQRFGFGLAFGQCVAVGMSLWWTARSVSNLMAALG